MKKTKITIQQAVADIKTMFDFKGDAIVREDAKSFFAEADGVAEFYINKRHYQRHEVIRTLQGYFNDKVIEGGRCEIDGTTFVFTKVSIKANKLSNT